MKATGEEVREVRLRKGGSSHWGPMFSDSLSPKAQDIYTETQYISGYTERKGKRMITQMAYLFCATFVFSTTRINALTVHRLQRDDFTEGSASGFASVKSMAMLLFASMKKGPNPYPTVLKMLQNSRF